MDQLTFENEMVLTVVQALIGSVGPATRAISVATNVAGRELTIYVAASSKFEEPEFLEDLVFEIDALTGGSLHVRTEVWMGQDWTQNWPGRDHRMVYAALRH